MTLEKLIFFFIQKKNILFSIIRPMSSTSHTSNSLSFQTLSHEYLYKECNSYSSHNCQPIKYKLCKYILFNILQSSFYPTHKKNVNYQGRIQDLWLGGAWVGEGSGDGPQLVQGRILIGGQGGEAPLKLWGF